MEPQVQYCTTEDGTRLAYTLLGDETEPPPLVQVNSWFYYQKLWWTAGQWRQPEALRAMFEGLARGRWLITFDRRGVGGSQRNVADVSLEAHLADLSAIVGHLRLERFDLSGWYDGAAVCLAYAVKHPERVSRLVLYSPRRAIDWASSEAASSVVELIRRDWALGRRMLADLVFPDAPPEVRHGQADALRDGISPDVAARYVEYMTTLDLSPLLPRVQAPVLVLEPRRVATREGAGQAIAAMMPDARLALLENEAIVDSEEMLRHFQLFLAEGREDHGEMSTIPSGMTAILFLDIADSTALTTKLGDAAYREQERALDSTLRSAITGLPPPPARYSSPRRSATSPAPPPAWRSRTAANTS